MVDADQGLAASQRALKACVETNDPLLIARTQLLGACLRLEYDRWSAEDAATCANARDTIARLGDRGQASEEGICKYYEVWDTNRLTLQGEYQAALQTAELGLASINESAHLVAYVFALHGKCIALMRLGQLGQALEIIRAARSQAEKNGNKAWLFMLREAWLRVLFFDFEGARQLCEEIVAAQAPYMAGQPKTMSVIADGYAALYEKNYEVALRCFREARLKPPSKFFLHWFFSMHAELGSANALLGQGDIVSAHEAADRFLKSALSTADPGIQALAWELRARVAIAQEDWSAAQDYIENAETLVAKFEIPNSAWRVHSSVCRISFHRGLIDEARKHREKAKEYVYSLANSFPEHEPLRKTFLSAEPVRCILSLP
jgi:tetratricopeptide (TPR) repeat protein